MAYTGSIGYCTCLVNVKIRDLDIRNVSSVFNLKSLIFLRNNFRSEIENSHVFLKCDYPLYAHFIQRLLTVQAKTAVTYFSSPTAVKSSKS